MSKENDQSKNRIVSMEQYVGTGTEPIKIVNPSVLHNGRVIFFTKHNLNEKKFNSYAN